MILVTSTSVHLTKGQARRIALAAQGIGRYDRDRVVTMRQVQSVIDDLALFQIDSVNVLARAHLMPLFSRLGEYDTNLLTRAAFERPQRLFEYWGHEASLIDIDLYPALRFRMARVHPWSRLRDFLVEHPDGMETLLAALRHHGPATPRDLDNDIGLKKRGWWNWSIVKTQLEWLFYSGQVAVASRNNAFERVFDLPERILPLAAVQAEPLTPTEAHLALVRRAASALGVTSARSLGDYFRTKPVETKQAIDILVASGELLPAQIRGLSVGHWLWHQARRPRSIEAATLVSPFDSLVFERRRLLELFDVEYKIGLYTPAAERTYGYYVYLFVLGDSILARVDLKADRKTKHLLVQSSWIEAAAEKERRRVAGALAEELQRLAKWVNCGEIVIKEAGNFHQDLAKAMT